MSHKIAWVRSVDWCNRHDIAWASHSDLGVFIEKDCQRWENWIKDHEYTDKVGEPPEAGSQ